MVDGQQGLVHMKTPAPVLRILLFTSEECKFCPEVDRIVRKHVGNQRFVNVTPIDVNLNPDIAERFSVIRLPTVVINNQRVLEGYMSEEDIRDRLWNILFQNILARDPALEKRRESVFALTHNMVQSASQKKLIRRNIGDYVHLGALQIANMSLLALDRLASHLIYDAARMQGLYGPAQLMLTTSNPSIFQQIKVANRFRAAIQGIVRLMSDHTQFPVYTAERAEVRELTDSTALVRVYGSAYAVGAPTLGEPLCWSLAGEVAGQIQSVVGRPARVTETACHGLGQTWCEFFVELVSEEEATAVGSDEKGQTQERRIVFQTTLMEMSEQHQNSLFLKSKMRPQVGDFVHIAEIQGVVTAIKLMDPFCGMLLYSAGSVFGLTGPGKHLLQEELGEDKVMGSLSLEEAVRLVVWELKHPTTQLSRQHSFVRFEVVSEERAVVVIKENYFSAGTPDVGETFCDFTAGFLRGRLQLLVEDDVLVSEVSCVGSGGDDCRFEIALD